MYYLVGLAIFGVVIFDKQIGNYLNNKSMEIDKYTDKTFNKKDKPILFTR